MKIIDWIDSETAKKYKCSIGGCGGYFKAGMRGNKDYYKKLRLSKRKYYRALREEIIKKQIKIGGDTHQTECIPLFSNNTTGEFSSRAWGDLMAAIWSEEENKDYNYMDFYMECLIKDKWLFDLITE